MWRKCFLGAILLAGIVGSAAELTIAELPEKPVIDGKLDDACWSKLPWQSGFSVCGGKTPAQADTRFKAFTSGGTLYLAIEAFEPAISKLVREKREHDSPAIWRNDSIEINLVPDPKAMSFYKFIIDAAGQYTDMQLTDDNTDSGRFNAFAEWNGLPKIGTAIGKTSWMVEAAIPLGAMEINEKTGPFWRFNISRHRWAGGKVESSSYAPLPKPGTLQPLAFAKAKLEGFKAGDYPLNIASPEFTFGRGGDGVLEFKVDAAIRNRTKNFRLVKIQAVLSDGKNSFQHSKVEPVKGLSYAKTDNVIREVPPGEYLLNFSVYSNSSKPVLLANRSQKVKLEYSPLEIRLVNPAYRNYIYASMPDKTLKADIRLNENLGIPLKVTLSDDKDFRQEQLIAAAGKVNRVSFDMAALPDGRYTLTVAGTGDHGDFQQRVAVRKLPYRKGEVWLDGSGVTYIDGQKTLPFGWYGNQPNPPDSSLNWIICLTPFGTIDEAVDLIRKNLASGQRTVIYMTQEIPGKAWSKRVLFAENARRGGLSKEQREKIIEFVSAVGKTDGLLGWYMADEPEGRDNNPLFYEEALEIIKEHDPYHPGIMLNYGLHGIRKYYRGADILLPDCYVKYWEDGTTEKPRSSSSEWVKTAAELRPTWLCTQMSLWPPRHPNGKLRGAPPDYRDQRMQFWQGVIHNAKGFSMYTYYYGQIYSSLIIGHVELGRTLQLLRDYVLADTVPNGVEAKTASGGQAFQVGLKKFGNGLCLIAVNTSTVPVKVDFALKNRFSGVLHEAGGKGVFQVTGGKFSDMLAAKESRIYLTDTKLAAAVPNVAEIEQRIAEHRAGRLKKGNLIGTGELYEADYLDFAAGKIPAHMAKLKASSDAIFHATKKTGSLYHLLDGLTEPTRVEFSWSPKASDPQPYLEIALPKAVALRELKLYTPNGNLEACRVIAGGKTFTVEHNRSEVIAVPLGGMTADRVRIEITKIKTALADHGKPAGKRLLTEVELY